MSTYEGNRYNFTGANVTGIPTSAISSGTFADARLSSSSVTQHVDLTALSASNLTSGTIPDARFPATLPAVSGANLTNTSVASTVGTWSPSASFHTWTFHQAKYVKVGRVCHVTGRFQQTASDGGGSGSGENSAFYFGGLPFTSYNGGNPVGGGYCAFSGGYRGMTMVGANSTNIYIWYAQTKAKDWGQYGFGGGFLQRNYSQYMNGYSASDKYVYVELTYITAS